MPSVPTADNLTTFIYRLSVNLEASTFWNTHGLSRPVQGLLSLFTRNFIYPRFNTSKKYSLYLQMHSCDLCGTRIT